MKALGEIGDREKCLEKFPFGHAKHETPAEDPGRAAPWQRENPKVDQRQVKVRRRALGVSVTQLESGDMGGGVVTQPKRTPNGVTEIEEGVEAKGSPHRWRKGGVHGVECHGEGSTGKRLRVGLPDDIRERGLQRVTLAKACRWELREEKMKRQVYQVCR